MKVYKNSFGSIINPEALFIAWGKFRKGKSSREDVMKFEWNLERNIFRLHHTLATKTYRHGKYSDFYITDPKQRHIHKATVRDRVVHHALFQVLNLIFEPTFISRSFSCQIGKGTHKGIDSLERMTRQASKNYTKPCFALKCDVRRFFDSVNHEILLRVLSRRLKDADTMWLLEKVVRSFISERATPGDAKGLPIGNLTSQLFANVYMNEFDQFVKHRLRVRYYVRYTDDFVVLSDSAEELMGLLPVMEEFLYRELKLELHPGKVSIRSLVSGVDFLGCVLRPHHRTPRTRTSRRMFRSLSRKTEAFNQGLLSEYELAQTVNSYLGVLSHMNGHKLKEQMLNQLWLERKYKQDTEGCLGQNTEEGGFRLA